MNKLVLLLLLLCFCLGNIHSQNKQDYYWPHAQDWDAEKPGIQGFELDFNNLPFEPAWRDSELSMGANNASICAAEGKLLFYTNGCAIANGNHEIMLRGDSINAGPHFFDFWGGDCDRGYPGSQNIIILEDPKYSDGYYIIHKPFSYHPDGDPNNRFSNDSLQYTYVDMILADGLGEVVEKNINFYEGHILSSYLTAIHQSNSKDWWIINPKYPSGFLLFSLTSDGFQLEQNVSGPTYDKYSSSAGHARFSPDGKKFAYFNETDGLYLYDFDRADASFSNLQILDFPMPENPWFTTCEWSPSSRFLYLSKSDTLWQLDTWTQPLKDGLLFIAGDPQGPKFEEAALGPDCRIYIRGKSGSRTFHIIHKPDEPGLACDLVEQSLDLPTYSAAGSFPNFPRFRVEEEEKCDPSIVSIVGEAVWWHRDLTVYPSPTTGPLTIELPEDHYDGMVYVLDMQGQIVIHKEVQILIGELRIDLGYLPSGIYSVEYVPEDSKDKVVWTKKVIKE